jgi:ElaB/YqjD/DUF883 family membrane-anchored ribosome-binding protein
MDQEPDVIRQQIEQTRGSLTEKLESVEDLVREKVSAVTSTVERTIDTVKSKVEDTVQAVSSTVESTVDTVKRTFDVSHQVRRYPYAMTGGALVVGAALGYLLAPRARSFSRRSFRESLPSYPPPSSAPVSNFEEPRYEERRQQKQGLFASLAEPFAAEFDKMKATAIGALMGLARDFAIRSVPPSLAPQIEEIVNNVTRRAGGNVVSGPVLPSSRDEPRGHG